jgi:CIC family chloride channel protein
MTSVFMIFEITQDYQILVPLMVANLLSFVISRHYQSTPVYHALLHQDGIHLPAVSARGGAPATEARHVMTTDLQFVPGDLLVNQALEWLSAQDATGVLVGSRESLQGAVTRGQLEQWRAEGRGGAVLAAALPSFFVHTHDDHPIDVVLERLWQSGGLLPVVSRADVHKVEGLVTAESILRGGRAAVSR